MLRDCLCVNISSHSKWSHIHRAQEECQRAEWFCVLRALHLTEWHHAWLCCQESNPRASLTIFFFMIAGVLEGQKNENFGLIWMLRCLVGVEGEKEDFPGLYKDDWFLSHPNVPSAERTGRWERVETTAVCDSGCRRMLLLPLLVKIFFGHLNDIEA